MINRGPGQRGAAALSEGPGHKAPNFSAVDLQGRDVSLADYQGEVVLLNIWATWCLPCRREMPALERLHREQEGDGLRWWA